MTSPFLSEPQSFRGESPSRRPPFPTGCGPDPRSKRLWLGDPSSGYGMVELPPVSKSGLAAPRSRGRVVHGLYGGGMAVTARPNRTRSWTYSWTALSERGYQVLQEFDAGGSGFGTPPWALLEPEGVNRLTRVQSMCTGAGWTPTSGTVATSSAAPYITPCGVMQWTPGASGARLIAGLVSGGKGVPDTTLGMPNVPAEFVAFTCYAAVATGTTTAHVRLTGMNGDGSGSVVIDGPSANVGTNWTQLRVVVGPGAYGTLPWVLPSVAAESTTPLLLCNPQASYTSAPMDWGAGGGVPRVHFTAELPRDLTAALWSGVSVTLTEAVTGAL